MTTLAPTFIAVEMLTTADIIRYGGETYTVADVLPYAVLSGWTVTGNDADGKRWSLSYANDDAFAELFSTGGA